MDWDGCPINFLIWGGMDLDPTKWGGLDLGLKICPMKTSTVPPPEPALAEPALEDNRRHRTAIKEVAS